MADTDGDGLSDFVEVVSRTNPLGWDLTDTDRDGASNATVRPTPIAEQRRRVPRRPGYVVQVSDADPTPGAPATTGDQHLAGGHRARPDPLGNIIPAGTNDILLYFQAGRSNDPHGVGIAETFEQRVLFTPPQTKDPPGTIGITPDGFVVGR